MPGPLRRATRAACAGALAAGWLGCGAPPPPAPSVVIDATPTWVCRGDDHRTEVILDASGSQSRLTLVPVPDPPTEPPLELEWRLSGSAWRLVEGDLRAERLRLTLAADRPLHVVLEARNADGGQASALRTIGIAACEAPP
ncbi:MAG: hypothetical protein IT376_08140 [Polyangiaceae bacterium]|nr:hypothetical protein [Polyangiaceae bacterium]